MSKSLNDRLAVCSWSLQPASPRQLVEHLQAIGISRVQLALDPLRESPETWAETAALDSGPGAWAGKTAPHR